MIKPIVQSPYGEHKGPVNSMVGKGESLVDFQNQQGSIVKTGKVGVDNKPSSISQNDNTFIAGNDNDWSTGNTFAQEAAPHTAQLEQINKMEKKAGRFGKLSSLSKSTADFQQKQVGDIKQNALANLQKIAQQQQYQHQVQQTVQQQGYKKGKDLPGYDSGSNGWAYMNGYSKYPPLQLLTNFSNRTLSNNPIVAQNNTDGFNGWKWQIPGVWDGAKPYVNGVNIPKTLGNYVEDPNAPYSTSTSNNTSDSTTTPKQGWWSRLTSKLRGNGYGTNWVPDVATMIGGIAQYNNAANQDVWNGDVYAKNPYESRALNTMAGLRTDTTPLLNQIYDAERRGRYANNNSGGYTNAQRHAANQAMAIASGANAANVYAAAQQQDNQYRQQYADALSKFGSQDQQYRIAANQFNIQQHAAALGARYAAMDQGNQNLLLGLGNAYKNYNKWRTWQDTKNLYNTQLTNDQIALLNQYQSKNS